MLRIALMFAVFRSWCVRASPQYADLLGDTSGRLWESGGDFTWEEGGAGPKAGEKSACSGQALGDSQVSTLYTEVEGPQLMTFFWRVSCEEISDQLTVRVNGKVKALISGDVAWKPEVIVLPPGNLTVIFEFTKDSSTSVGEDRGCVASMEIRDTDAPTMTPTENPTTTNPTAPTSTPTAAPSLNPTTLNPTFNPTSSPTNNPTTINPTSNPTSSNPTRNPTTSNPTTLNPSENPTANPTSANPTANPTTVNPTSNPTRNPTSSPTSNPTSGPTSNPTSNPTSVPTSQPEKLEGFEAFMESDFMIWTFAGGGLLVVFCVILIIVCYRRSKRGPLRLTTKASAGVGRRKRNAKSKPVGLDGMDVDMEAEMADVEAEALEMDGIVFSE